MSSPSSNENLSAYFDRESSAEESREVESLLEQSAAARQELHEFGEISRLLQETATESAPPELAPSIRKRIEQETLLTSPQTETAPAPAGPSMLRYRIAVAISACSSLAALVLFILLLNIPENPTGTNWSFSSNDHQVALLHEAEPTAESKLALREDEISDSYQREYKFQGKPLTNAKLKTAAASPANAPAVSMRMASPAPVADKLNAKAAGQVGAGVLEKGTADFAVSNTMGEKKAMERMAKGNALNSFSLPEVPQMSGLPAHIPVDTIRIGDVLPYFQDINGKVAVIEVRVVDVKEALGTMELLLTRNNIPVNKEKQSEVERQLNRAKSLNYQPADQKKSAAAAEDELFAVFVEASDTQVASALNDLQKDLNQRQLLGLSLQPAIDESTLTKSVKDLPRLLAEHTGGTDAAAGLRGSQGATPAGVAPFTNQADGLELKPEALKEHSRVKKQTSYQTQYRMQVPPEQLAQRTQQMRKSSDLPTLLPGQTAPAEAPLMAQKPQAGVASELSFQKRKAEQRLAGKTRPSVKVLFVFKNRKQSPVPATPPASR